MTAPHADQLIDGYLARIRVAAGDLPAGAREELIADVRAHIDEARRRESSETDATILNILDRLGDPSLLVAESAERGGAAPLSEAYRPGILEIVALVVLPFLWPVGVILLWISPAWKTRDKIIGTVLPPGGYPGLLMILLSTHHAFTISGNGGFAWWQMIEIVLLSLVFYGLPIATAGYLAFRLHWGRRLKTVAA